MLRFLVYFITFFLGYRLIKRLFAPQTDPGHEEPQQRSTYNYNHPDKSDIVEDVDYEEVDWA